ncbi:hypothetical protein [Mycolicibacterium conceptionense]|uniref:hypothetical protein n=1 Tax=Mycolicibacterium conceptionense TaxID=451644 RepID=UPI003204810D
MTNFKPGDKVRRRHDAPVLGAHMPGIWVVSAILPGPLGPILRITQGKRVNVVLAEYCITERHARVIAAHAESVRRVGAERVARLARLWAAR